MVSGLVHLCVEWFCNLCKSVSNVFGHRNDWVVYLSVQGYELYCDLLGSREEGGALPFMNWGYAVTEDDRFKRVNQRLLGLTPVIDASLSRYIEDSRNGSSESQGDARKEIGSKELSKRHDMTHNKENLCGYLYATTLLAGAGEHKEDVSHLQDKHIVEVGCGRGGGALVLHSLCTPKSYLGIDAAKKNIQVCNLLDINKNTHFKHAKAENLQLILKPNSTDILFNVESSHCYADLYAFASGVYRCLKPGGQFLWADQMVDSKYSFAESLTFEYAVKCFADVGFRIEDVYDVRQNVLKAIDKGSLDAYRKESEGDNMTWTRKLNHRFLVWYGTVHRTRMLKTGRMTYHIVSMTRPTPAQKL